jgi:serine/threonine protein kinase
MSEANTRPRILNDTYEVFRSLGEGAFGQVLLATDLAVKGRLVAIKVLRDRDPNRHRLLIHEMETLSRLSHPSIVVFHHHFLHEGQLHLVMEFCKNGSLRRWLAQQETHDEPTIMAWAIRLTETLEFAHSKGIVHHDIKPDNILLAEDGSIKIADFGIANTNGGTLSYLPPEVLGPGEISPQDPRVDIYSLGVTLIELLTGHNPLVDLRGDEIILARLREEFVPTTLPRWLQEVLLRATRSTPELRFQTMDEFAQALTAKAVPFILDSKKIKSQELAQRGERLLRLRKWKRSGEAIEAALRLWPDSVPALVASGRYHLRLRHTEAARLSLERALRLNRRVDVQRELGWLQLESGSYSHALATLHDYLQRNPADLEAQNLLLEAYFRTGRYEMGIKVAQLSIGVNACFANNCLICRLLLGDAPNHIMADLPPTSSSDPFVEYNCQVASELGITWNSEQPRRLADKLLFEEYRFGLAGRVQTPNTIRLEFSGGRVLEFERRIVTIGRVTGNSIPLNDNAVSRRHCVIINYRDDVWLHDLGSVLGTALDGAAVNQRAFILGVKTLSIGNTDMRIASEAGMLI